MESRLRSVMTARVIDGLYLEAMVLADEARAYFDGRDASARAGADRDGLSPELRVSLACEALRVTTRLMGVIAWLLTRKAEAAGEIDATEATASARRLAPATESDPALVARLPVGARTIIASAMDLHARIARLDAELTVEAPASPARSLLGRLEGIRF